MRHTPNRRMYARARPHRWQRWYLRTPNLGFRFAFSMRHVFAMRQRSPYPIGTGVSPRKGIPISRSKAIPTSSRPAVVTNVMSIPWIFSTLS
jgi:hypothetical protein